MYLFSFGKVPTLLSTPCFLRPEKSIRILIFGISKVVNHSTQIVRPWDPSMLGLLNILSVFLSSDFDASSSEVFVNLARDASWWIHSAIFTVLETTSMSNEATVITGIISRRSVCCQELVFSNNLRLSAADFAITMWDFATETYELFIVLIARAMFFKAWLDSELIVWQDSWNISRISWGVCNSDLR